MNKIFELGIFKKNQDLGILIIRLSVGILMLLHGLSKLQNGVGFIEQTVLDNGLPSFITYGVYIGEVIAPIFIIFGFGTRLAALVFAFNCLVATLLVHSSDILTLNSTGGWGIELLGLYFFGALALVFTGGGKYALSKKHLWD